MSYYSGSYGAGMGAALLIPGLLSLAVSILMIIAQWRLFTKAGEAGWKCLIPFYGQYTWCKIVWSAKIFWIMLGIAFGTGILSGILTASAANRYGSPGAGAIILGILMAAAAIWMLVIAIRMLIYTARAYGKSGGFAAGLFFLAPIFLCILAFGDSEYVGPMGIAGSRPESSASNDEAAAETGEEADSSRHSLIWIIVGVCALILCFATVKRFVLAATDFRPTGGIFGNPWVGLKSFERLIASPQLPAAVRNSLVSGFITLLVSALFSLLGGAAGMSDSRSGKAIAAAFGAAIAFVPSVIFDSVLIRARMTAVEGFQPLIPVVHALPLAGVSLLLGALLPAAWPRRSRFLGVLIAPLLTLASLFMDYSVVNLLQNALNLRYTETISTHIYKLSFLSFQISYGAAAEIIQSLLNLIPALLGALLTGILVKKSRPAVTAISEKSGAGVSVTAGAIAGGVILLAGALLFSRDPSVFRNSSVFSSCVITLVTALLVAVLAFGIYFAVLLCAGRFDSGRWLPFALLVLLSVGFNRTSIVDYLTARNLNLVNTVVMPALCAIVNPLSLMLLLGMIIIRPRRVSACVLFALGAALLSAAHVMGDVSTFVIYVTSRSGWNLGTLLRSALVEGNMAASSMTSSGAQIDMSAAENLRMSLMGVSLLFVALPVGIGTAFCVRASLRKG